MEFQRIEDKNILLKYPLEDFFFLPLITEINGGERNGRRWLKTFLWILTMIVIWIGPNNKKLDNILKSYLYLCVFEILLNNWNHRKLLIHWLDYHVLEIYKHQHI